MADRILKSTRAHCPDCDTDVHAWTPTRRNPELDGIELKCQNCGLDWFECSNDGGQVVESFGEYAGI